MSQDAFILPADARLGVREGRMALEHTGDIVLGQTLGLTLARLRAGGDATLKVQARGVVQAGGTVTLLAGADADRIEGDLVELDGGRVKARVIVGRTAVVVRDADLDVQMISAPEVVFSPEARGTVAILDTAADPGRSAVRGCASLSDHAAAGHDVDELLDRLGVEPVVAPRLPEPEPEPPTAEVPRAQPETSRTQPLFHDVAPRSSRRAPDRLAPAVSALRDAYGPTAPAPVLELGRLVDAGKGAEVAATLDTFWRETLRAHLERGDAPPRRAVLAFHAMRAAS